MDVDLAERTVAGVHEAVGSVGGNHHDLAGPHLPLLVAGRERRLPFLHDEDLLVRVPMHPRTTTWRRVDEEDRDAHASVVIADELAGDHAEGELALVDHVHGGSNRRTLAASWSPGRSPREGTGSPYETTTGTTPAQVLIAASGESSSVGGPDRAFNDTSSIVIARIAVAFSSLRFGSRTSSQRPRRSLLVNVRNAARRSTSSSMRSKLARTRPRTSVRVRQARALCASVRRLPLADDPWM